MENIEIEELYLTEEVDYTQLPQNFQIILYIGGTGSGKTYTAINKAKSKKFAIAVPTRQLGL